MKEMVLVEQQTSKHMGFFDGEGRLCGGCLDEIISSGLMR